MKIVEKFIKKQSDLHSTRQPVIAFLGDSVTQGCFEIYNDKGKVTTTFYPEEAYSAKVKKIFSILYPSVSVNIINAGISGDTSWNGLNRLERDVLCFSPDLVVVCYGLNDASRGDTELQHYGDSLRKIFEKIHQSGAEAIFMTPNLRCDFQDYTNSDKVLENCIRGISKNERDGWLSKYLELGKEVANELCVKVCDCNEIWKQMKECGVDTNSLLSNNANHPTRELHWLFAYELVKTMLSE